MDLSDCTSQSELIYEGTESMVNHARSSSPGTCLTDTTEDLQSLGDESSRTTADDELLNSYTASYGDDLPIDAGEQVRSQTKQVTFQDTVEVAALSSIASSLIDSTSEEHSQEETCKTASLGMIREEDGVIERHRQAKGYQIKETRRLSSHICEWNGDRKLLTIYSDWANHYLEKASYTNFVKDIQKDLRDGVLLADIVHAVVDERVPNLFRNPKTSSQALSNVSACLQLLRKIGVETEGVSAEGISKGELKYILGLFFNLSKYKQELKNRCLSDGVSVVPNGNNFGTTELDKSQTKFGYKACVRQASEVAASDCTTIPRTGSKPSPPGHKTDSEHFSQLPKLSKPSQPQSDSALSPSVSNVSPVSAATLSLGSDRHFKPSSSRLATVRVVPSPAPFSSPTSSSTSSGCISGARGKSHPLRTNIPINLKTRPSCSPTSQKPTKFVGKSGQNGITPSARGLTKQPSSTTASDEYSFSSYSEIASVTCDLNTAYSPKSTPNANSERSSNPSTPIKQKSATETNSEPIQDHKIDQNPSVIRPHSTLPTGNSGLPKRHFTRHPAVTSSKSTVSDGELDRSIPNLPPALPRLSADRTQLFSAVSGFESENPSDSPSSTGSGIPMSKTSGNPASSSDVRRFFHRNASQSREGSSNVPNPVRCPEAFEKAANPNSRSPLCQRALIPQENANNLMYHRSCNAATESALIQAQQPVIAPQRADALISPSHRVKQKQVLNYAGASNSRPMHSHEPGPCTQGHPIAVTMISHTSGPMPMGAFPHQMHPGYPGLFYAPYPIPAQPPIGVHAHGPITNPHFHQHSALPHRTPTHHQACPPNHHRQQHDQQPTVHGNLNNPPVTPMRTASAVHYLDQSSSCPPVSECSVHPANPPFVPPAVYRPQSHPIPPTRAQSLQSNPNTETCPPSTVHAVSMQPSYTQTDPSTDNVIRRPSNNCLEQPNHPVLNRQPESADTSRIERMTVNHSSKRVPGLLPRQVSTDRRWADPTDQVQKVATAPNPPTSPFTSSQRARPEVETEKNAPTQHRANSHAEQRQKARELYAALKHRHPTTNTELKERESNVSIQRLPLRRASTSNTQAISSPLFSTRMHSQLHPGQNEINQTSPQIDLPANSTHSSVNGKPSGTTTAKTNSQIDTEVVAKISSEQISQLFQSGDPRFRSYLQSLARHVRTTQSATTSNQQTSHHQRANPGDSSQIQSGRIIPGPRISTQSSVCSDDEQPKWGSLKCSNEGPSILNGSYKKSDSEMICGYQSDGGVDCLKAKDATSPSPLRSSLSTNSKDIARLDIINSLPRNLRLSVLGKDECLINLNEYNPQSVGSANGQPNLSNYTRLMQERMQEGMRAAQESLWLSEDASPSCSESGSTNKEKIASNNREESSTDKASASGSSEINEAVCELEGLNADTWSSTVVSNGGLGLRKLGIDMGQISSAILRTLTTTSTGLTPNLSDIADSNLPKSTASPNVTAPSSSSSNTRTPKFSWENNAGMSIRLTDKEMNGLGALGYRRISDRNHNTPSSSDLKNGTCSDIEDLLNQQERRTKALRNSNGNSADCKRALNSASDTEDLVGCRNQLVGTVYGYTLPGPNQPYPYTGYPRTSLGCIKTTAELLRPGQSYIPPKWNMPTYGANHRDQSKTEIKPAVQSSACTHSKETTSDHSNTGLSHRPESISTDDTERIYGIVPLSPTYLHRQLLPGSNAATRGTALSFNSKSSMHGTVSAPPGTPIKLPYAPPSSVVAAATTRISAGGEGSNLSLLSNASHNSAIEEKQAEEIQRLKNKLECAREEIATLTAQLATNITIGYKKFLINDDGDEDNLDDD